MPEGKLDFGVVVIGSIMDRDYFGPSCYRCQRLVAGLESPPIGRVHCVTLDRIKIDRLPHAGYMVFRILGATPQWRETCVLFFARAGQTLTKGMRN
jgi:hypothetical protein